MNAWINGRRSSKLDYRDRGLQYGDGIFETMRVRGGRIRLSNSISSVFTEVAGC